MEEVVGFVIMAPNHQRWYAKMEALSEYVSIAYTFFARLAPICIHSRCLINKISASELSRKFIKSALLVGQACVPYKFKTYPTNTHHMRPNMGDMFCHRRHHEFGPYVLFVGREGSLLFC